MERPPCVVSPGDALFHQHGHGAEVRFRGKRFQKGGRRGGDLLVTTLLDDLPGDGAVLQIGAACHLPMEGRRQVSHTIPCVQQQVNHFFLVANVDGPLAGGGISLLGELLHVIQQKARHFPAHGPGPSCGFHEQVTRMGVQQLGVQIQKRVQLPIPDGQNGLVVVTDAQGALAHRVHEAGDAPGHAAQELLGLGHGVLLPLPLFHQRLDDGALLLLAQMHHGAARVFLHTTDLHVPGMGGLAAVERLRHNGGDEVHPVQVVTSLTQGLAGDEVLDNVPLLVFIVPGEADVQVHALALAVIHLADDVCSLGNLPPVFPRIVQEKILIGQIAHPLQPVLQRLKHLLGGGLAHVFQLAGIFFGGLPPLQFNYIHLSALLLSISRHRGSCTADRPRGTSSTWPPGSDPPSRNPAKPSCGPTPAP